MNERDMCSLPWLAFKVRLWWRYIQDLASLRGGLYIDAFAVVMIARLLAPLKGGPALTPAEAGMWAATIGAFAYSGRGPKQS